MLPKQVALGSGTGMTWNDYHHGVDNMSQVAQSKFLDPCR